MSYDTCCEPRGEAKCAEPMETFLDIVKANNKQAHEIRFMVRRLYCHLFGFKDSNEGECPEPACIRDELHMANCTQVAVLEELGRISGMLGL